MQLIRVQPLIVILCVTAATLYGILRARVKLPTMRRLPAVEAIDEGIGRCLETGRKVHCGVPSGSPMGGGRDNPVGGLIAFPMAQYVAQKSAEKSVPTIYTCGNPAGFLLLKSVVQEAYTAQGKLDDFRNPDICSVRFLAGQSFGYQNSVNNLLQRENCGATFYFGSTTHIFLYSEGARDADALSIMCFPQKNAVAYAVFFDYYMVLGENFAFSAMITKNPYQLGSLVGNDIISWGMFILGACLAIAATVLGSSLVHLITTT